MTAQEALDAPRVHNEGAEPIGVEERAGADVIEALQGRGHQVQSQAGIGGPRSCHRAFGRSDCPIRRH